MLRKDKLVLVKLTVTGDDLSSVRAYIFRNAREREECRRPEDEDLKLEQCHL